MTTSSLRRSVKNIVNNYTDAEIKVREATSNDPWGPPSSLMAEISELTFNVVAFAEVMGIIWKRLNDHGKNWRHVYKALTLLDYLIKAGSERVAQHCRENIHAIQTLRDFQYVDREGQDQGINVREKAKQLVHLLQDGEKLKHERSQAHKTRQRMAGAGGVSGYGSMPPPYPGRRTSQPSMAAGYGGEEHVQAHGSPTSHNSSTPSPHLAPDMEQARPQTVGEEELQLQLALAMSREESEKPPPPVDIDEQTQLQIAMSLSKEEAQKKPAPPSNVALEMDEETQLQLALSLSKEEHQQEQQSRLGDESLLQKALEESKRDMEAKAGGSAMLDLMDIFAPAAEAPLSGSPWELAGAGAGVQAIGPSRSDPWDSLDPSSPSRGMGSTWTSPPASLHSQPWDHRNRPADVWDAPGPVPPGQLSKPSGLGIDPFSPLSLDRKRSAALDMGPSPKPGSPIDGALFDDVMDGGRMNLNGRSEDSPELFDLSRLGQNLGETTSRTCRTPEAFLGPEGASLVNLDSLIPMNPASKNLNPFLTGLTAPSVTNPFQSEAPRLTLNQLRPNSSSPAPSSLPYSASLPLPVVSHQPSSLPSSFTQPAEGHANVPRTLPQPLLPLSSTAAHGPPDQSQNPFL